MIGGRHKNNEYEKAAEAVSLKQKKRSAASFIMSGEIIKGNIYALFSI